MLSTPPAPATRWPTVVLDPDHPGFRDPVYRARRDQIAALAYAHEPNAPIPEVAYTDAEHGVWRTVHAALAPRHAAHAAAEFHAAAERLRLPRDHIPQLGEISARIEALSAFRLQPVPGLVEAPVFLEALADGALLSTQYIRHHSAPLYTPEPDVVHELVGHVVMLASPRIAECSRAFGRAARRARTREEMQRLARLYWYTLEFGVVREGGELKAYGAGLLSSAGELEAMARAEIRPLLPETVEEVSRTPYDPTTFQPHLYCAPSFDSLLDTLARALEA